jgi:hypothetical protein
VKVNSWVKKVNAAFWCNACFFAFKIPNTQSVESLMVIERNGIVFHTLAQLHHKNGATGFLRSSRWNQQKRLT